MSLILCLEKHNPRVAEVCINCIHAISMRRFHEVDGFQTRLGQTSTNETAAFQSFCEDWFPLLCKYIVTKIRHEDLQQTAKIIRSIYSFEDDAGNIFSLEYSQYCIRCTLDTVLLRNQILKSPCAKKADSFYKDL